MNSKRINELLTKIQDATGVSLSYNETATFVDENETIAFLEKVLSPYKKRPEKEVFLANMLLDSCSDDEISDFLYSENISHQSGCIVYILNVPGGFDDTISGIISDLTDNSEYIVPIDQYSKAIVCFIDYYSSEQYIPKRAAAIVETLTADALVPANISYDGTVLSVFDVAIAYNHAMTAMQIGTRFFSQSNIFCYHKLGLEKLIYRLSEDDCREYLSDHMNGFSFSSLDSELSTTVHAFLDAGLSVAQTSRNMYIHRNTLLYRLDKFQKLSGLDLRAFDDAVTAKIAMLMELRLS